MMTTDSLTQRITRAIEDSPYRWRTARGIAKDLGIDEGTAFSTLENNKQFIRADILSTSGSHLYSTRGVYGSKTSRLRLLGDFLTGKVTI